ncbi:hypothetical protein CYMTET_37791 [Cymbomonas tetramitiformis]|uniref:Mitochondrial chaperone BCS1-like ATPase lid domain-containing protein n=1 Tax=Cymbomonas tetramitiformis TaxID=36881 RepID=A0AAE0F5W3_9CHLO|nr:hypothetical protein CYMTET_37791 [Cymbomonas tetramitiformis]
MQAYLKNFYGENLQDSVLDKYVDAIPPGTLSIAELQGCLVANASDPEAALPACRAISDSRLQEKMAS